MSAAVDAQPLVKRLVAQQRQRAAAASAAACTSAAGGTQACEAGGGSSGSAAAPEPPTAAPVGEPPRLVSGAGHDAMVFADVTRMGMLFVRCR